MRKIKITLHRDGTQTVEVLQAAGSDCLELTRDYETRAGIPAAERVLKPEYYETQAETEQEREVQR